MARDVFDGGIGMQAQGWRQDIVGVASQFVGAHYLWGTAGNTLKPGKRGLPDVDGNDDGLTDAKKSAAFGLDTPTRIPNGPSATARRSWGYQTAFCSTDGGHVCCGRYTQNPLGSIATYFSNPARNAKLLECFLDYKASKLPLMYYAIEWAKKNYNKITPDNPGPQIWFDTLAPRIGFAKKDAKATTNMLIWGEPCNGVRHFDCVGLINAAYCQGLGWTGITYDIWAWAKMAVEPVAIGTPVLPGDIIFKFTGSAAEALASARPPKTPPKPGPLPAQKVDPAADAGKWHHIALCVGDANGSVIQGEEGPVGVTLRSNLITPQGVFLDKEKEFNFRGRVSNANLFAWRQRDKFKSV